MGVVRSNEPQPGFFRSQRVEEDNRIELARNGLSVYLMFLLRIWVLLRQVQAFCHRSCPADIEQLQGVLRLARFDKKVGVPTIESIAVRKKGQPEFLVLNSRTLLFEATDGLAIPEICFRWPFLARIEVCYSTFYLPLQRWICR